MWHHQEVREDLDSRRKTTFVLSKQFSDLLLMAKETKKGIKITIFLHFILKGQCKFIYIPVNVPHTNRTPKSQCRVFTP